MQMNQTIAIGPHERADNIQSTTGWHATFLGNLSEAFNKSLQEYQDSLSSEGSDAAKTASVDRPLLHAALEKPLYAKSANFAGGPNPSEVEQALAQIAEQQIKSRAPALMPYWLGFQMLKKTDDNTRACGIFAFKVGDELIYIPVFCINGELRGHEMMYLVSQDRFVPSDEKQVNYLLSRKPIEPGKVELRDSSSIRQRSSLRPDLMQGGLKLSSLEPVSRLPKEIVEDALRKIFKEAALTVVKESPRFKYAMSGLKLSDLFNLSARATKVASQWSNDYPVYGRLLHSVLDGLNVHAINAEWQKRAALAKELRIVPVKKPTLQEYLNSHTLKEATKDAGYVSVKTASEIPWHQFQFMPTESVDQLHHKGYRIVDTRDQTKLATLVKAKNTRDITSPHLPGTYNVFMADGTFKKCVILREWTRWDTCDDRYVVFDTETGRNCRIYEGLQSVIVDNTYSDAGSFEAAVSGSLPAPSKKERDEIGSSNYPYPQGCLISPNKHVYVCGRGLVEHSKDSFTDYNDTISVVPGQKEFKRVSDSLTVVPQGTKAVWYTDNLALGDLRTWEELLYKNTVPVKVQRRCRETGRYSVDGTPEVFKAAALEYLMTRHYLPEKAAEYLLDQTDKAYPHPVDCLRTKVAFSGSPSRDSISVHFPEKDRTPDWLTGMDIEQRMDTSELVDALRNERPEHDLDFWPGAVDVEQLGKPPMPNARDVQLATQASESGQREFVSSQMLMSLLREVDDEGIISKYISVFEKACDALGRLYMQVLWRVDAFEERFGEIQLKEFKEMLLELFQRIGDFICYLRQRDIRPESRIALEHVTDIGQDFGSK